METVLPVCRLGCVDDDGAKSAAGHEGEIGSFLPTHIMKSQLIDMWALMMMMIRRGFG